MMTHHYEIFASTTIVAKRSNEAELADESDHVMEDTVSDQEYSSASEQPGLESALSKPRLLFAGNN